MDKSRLTFRIKRTNVHFLLQQQKQQLKERRISNLHRRRKTVFIPWNLVR